MSEQPRRLFLHIGLPKTATTYLQTCAWTNKAALAEQGLLLPGRHHRRHLLASQDFRHSPRLARLVPEGERPWLQLAKQVDEWAGDALISHEFFGSARPRHITEGLAELPEHEVHVIVTARPTVEVFISRWQEWVKNGNIGPIDEFPPATARRDGDWGWGTIDLGSVLGRWGSVLGPERIHVLPLRRDTPNPEEIWTRYLEVLGLAPEALPAPEVEANRSLGPVQVEVLRRANVHLAEELQVAQEKGAWIRGFLGEQILYADGPVERFRPGAAVLSDLIRRGDQALELLESGAYVVHGDLEDLRTRDVSQRRQPGDASAEELLEAASAAVAALTLRVRAIEESGPAGPQVDRADPARRKPRSMVARLLGRAPREVTTAPGPDTKPASQSDRQSDPQPDPQTDPQTANVLRRTVGGRPR